ncbi:MAG: hypothetical protein ACE5I7_14685 [Candidatus Binatia bacterium]
MPRLSLNKVPKAAAQSAHALAVLGLLGAISTALALAIEPTPALAGVPAGISEYYVPGATQQLWDIFKNLDDAPTLDPSQGMHNVTSITGATDNTTVYYDHWENGYNLDPNNPAATADETFVINRGQVQRLESSNIPVSPRGSGTLPACT